MLGLVSDARFVISSDAEPHIRSQAPFLADRFGIWAVFSCEGLISISEISVHDKQHFNLVFQFPVHSLHRFSSKNLDAWKLAFLRGLQSLLTFSTTLWSSRPFVPEKCQQWHTYKMEKKNASPRLKNATVELNIIYLFSLRMREMTSSILA